MAGGQGSRLRPLTSNQPKPMLPIVGRPMMEHVLRLASRHGITEAVATVHFLASLVRNYFGDGADLGMSIRYATEEEPRGTAGGVKNAQALLGDRFLVLSGDSVTDVDLTDLIRFHQEKGAAVTVTLKQVEDPLEFGIVITDADARVERFLEKPGWGDVFSDTINTGIYVVEREVLDFVPDEGEFDFALDLFPLLLEKGLPIFGYVTDRFWTDVGTVESYLAAHRSVLNGEVSVSFDGFEVQPRVWLGPGAELDPGAEVTGPVFVGEDSRIEAGATVREHTVIGTGVTVRTDAFLHRAIVHDYAYVGPSTSLRGCVVGRNTDLKFGARLEEGVVVADECRIGEGAVLNPGVRVYPFKTVDPGAVVATSIVWESGGARGLFGERGVAGLMNVDVTPEMAVRLALAYASLLPKGSVVATSRDPSRTARVVKRVMVGGLNAAGIEAHDLELIPSPVARFYVRTARPTGGIEVRSARFDPASVEIQFFDERGIDVGPSVQRQLERAYERDDVRRAFHHDLGQLTYPARALEYYTSGLLDALDVAAIRRLGPKLVIDYAWGATAVTGPLVLGQLAADVLGVNAVLDEERVVLSEDDVEAHVEGVRALTRSSGSDVGVLVDATGERLRLVDGGGRVLDGRTALLAVLWLVARTEERPTVGLPVSASRAAVSIVEQAGGRIRWTKLTPAALMDAAEDGDVAFAGDEDGGFVFPAFLPVLDAVFSLAKLLEMLSYAGTTLAAVVDALPTSHVAYRTVTIPWEAKGTVMRRLLEHLNGTDLVETIDGVKTFRGEDWALVVPHPQEPLVRVWAEAGSLQRAEALAAEFGALVESLKA
jgi:mannose-1-phosphate guanylyltransferase/phosphomannomutase